MISCVYFSLGNFSNQHLLEKIEIICQFQCGNIIVISFRLFILFVSFFEYHILSTKQNEFSTFEISLYDEARETESLKQALNFFIN